MFAIATLRKVHLGILMFPAACGVGVLLAGMPLREVVGSFPVNIMVLLAGVTYFFGIAQANGTIDRMIASGLAGVGERPVALPFVFFAGLAAAVAAMGSPQAGLVLAPVGMPVARRSGVDPVLMAIAINYGHQHRRLRPDEPFRHRELSSGARGRNRAQPVYAPWLAAAAANLVLLVGAFLMFGTREKSAHVAIPTDGGRGGAPASIRPTACRDAGLHGLSRREASSPARRPGSTPTSVFSRLHLARFLTLVDPSSGTPRLRAHRLVDCLHGGGHRHIRRRSAEARGGQSAGTRSHERGRARCWRPWSSA